jgi:hypothetical protein
VLTVLEGEVPGQERQHGFVTGSRATTAGHPPTACLARSRADELAEHRSAAAGERRKLPLTTEPPATGPGETYAAASSSVDRACALIRTLQPTYVFANGIEADIGSLRELATPGMAVVVKNRLEPTEVHFDGNRSATVAPGRRSA